MKTRTIRQSATFNTTAHEVYEAIMALGKHSQFTGSKVSMSREANVTISGKSLKLKEGDMVVMPANDPHTLRAIKRFKMMLVIDEVLKLEYDFVLNMAEHTSSRPRLGVVDLLIPGAKYLVTSS